ncbi:hypothetical protein [Legionella waltersii]|nr:hypothetical protein [Legionella waltersii]
MFLSMEELQKQIQLAKAKLSIEIESWLQSQDELTEKEKSHWRDVFSAANRTEMGRLIQEKGLPLFLITSLISEKVNLPNRLDQEDIEVPLESPVVPQQDNQILRTVYQRSSTNTSETVSQICELVNIMECLHQLEELSETVESNIDFSSITLAYKMAKNVNKEWQHAAKGRETVLYYSNRLETALQQHQFAKEECNGNLAVYQGQVEARILQFKETLHYFADCLTSSYGHVQDNRNWIARLLFAPISWHQMLKGVAIHSFNATAVVNPNVNSIQINPNYIQAMVEQYARIMRFPVDDFQSKINSRLNDSERQQIIAKENIQSMKSTLDTLSQVYSHPRLSPLLLPTRNLTMFGFFRGVVAAFGHNDFYSRFLAPTVQTEHDTPDENLNDHEFRQ